jgi:chromosome segregation ATPase
MSKAMDSLTQDKQSAEASGAAERSSLEAASRRAQEESRQATDLNGQLKGQLATMTQQRDELKKQVEALTRELTELKLSGALKQVGQDKKPGEKK